MYIANAAENAETEATVVDDSAGEPKDNNNGITDNALIVMLMFKMILCSVDIELMLYYLVCVGWQSCV